MSFKKKGLQIIFSTRSAGELDDILKACLRFRLQQAFGSDYKRFFLTKKKTPKHFFTEASFKAMQSSAKSSILFIWTIPLMCISQACAHPCAQKARLRPKSDRMFWNLSMLLIKSLVARAQMRMHSCRYEIWINMKIKMLFQYLTTAWARLRRKRVHVNMMHFWKISNFEFEKILLFWWDIIEVFVVRLHRWVIKLWQIHSDVQRKRLRGVQFYRPWNLHGGYKF